MGPEIARPGGFDMRIGILRDDTIVNSLYRTAIPMRALEARGHDVRWNCKGSSAFDTKQLLSCDVVHIHRYFDRDAQRLAASLRDAGVAIWWDNDDDVTAAPRGTAAFRELSGKRGAEIYAGMRRMMQLADLVTTPSEVLAAKYVQDGARTVEVLENHVLDEFVLARRRRNDDAVVIGWVAGAEHRVDVEQIGLEDALGQLLVRQPGVEVVTVGVKLGLRERYRHVAGVQLTELGETEAQFDIGIAPIADIPLNRSRSNVKVKEYAAAGVPWLASPVGPYRGLGEQQGGRLVSDETWLTEVERLVLDGRARRKLAKRAARWGARETIGKNVKQWEAALSRAVASARARSLAGAAESA